MNWKYFQLKSLTKKLDATFDDDYQMIKELHFIQRNKGMVINNEILEEEQKIFKEWEIYKVPLLKKLIQDCTIATNPFFKICLCDFIKDRRISIELWIKITYDIFMDELDSKDLKGRFWGHMKMRNEKLNLDLSVRNWPADWDYLIDEPCLCLEIIKLYEQYAPIRPFIAENINQQVQGKIWIDVRRMPILFEDKAQDIDFQRKSWFPKMTVCSHKLLETIYYSNSIFCNQILRFIFMVKDVIFPILDFFYVKNEAGTVVNIYGSEYEFMFEILYSLKGPCNKAVKTSQQSLRIDSVFKGNSDKNQEDLCKIVLTLLSQSDITEQVMQDIYNNLKEGYQVFQPQVPTFQRRANSKLVFLVSERKLNVKMARSEDILYHQIPDKKIREYMESVDYAFLQYYTNLLFGKVMSVHQSGGAKKPFYCIMLCMWTYVLPLYFSNKDPKLTEYPIFEQLKQMEQNVEIVFSDSESEEYDENVEIVRMGRLKKIKLL